MRNVDGPVVRQHHKLMPTVTTTHTAAIITLYKYLMLPPTTTAVECLLKESQISRRIRKVFQIQSL